MILSSVKQYESRTVKNNIQSYNLFFTPLKTEVLCMCGKKTTTIRIIEVPELQLILTNIAIIDKTENTKNIH